MPAVRSIDKPRVFGRTVMGQRVAVVSPHTLDDAERRLLLMVNGLTPMDELLALAPELVQADVVDKLEREGLIADEPPSLS